MSALPAEVAHFIASARVGRLATADGSGQPLVVPICYAWDGEALVSAIDAKPKRAGELARVRNIRENSKVSVVIDHSEEDWRRLRWVIIQGMAENLTAGRDFARAVPHVNPRQSPISAEGVQADVAGGHARGETAASATRTLSSGDKWNSLREDR